MLKRVEAIALPDSRGKWHVDVMRRQNGRLVAIQDKGIFPRKEAELMAYVLTQANRRLKK